MGGLASIVPPSAAGRLPAADLEDALGNAGRAVDAVRIVAVRCDAGQFDAAWAGAGRALQALAPFEEDARRRGHVSDLGNITTTRQALESQLFGIRREFETRCGLAQPVAYTYYFQPPTFTPGVSAGEAQAVQVIDDIRQSALTGSAPAQSVDSWFDWVDSTATEVVEAKKACDPARAESASQALARVVAAFRALATVPDLLKAGLARFEKEMARAGTAPLVCPPASSASATDSSKSKEQVKFMNSATGEPIATEIVSLTLIPGGDVNGPGDEVSQAFVDKIAVTSSYVVKASCKNEWFAPGKFLVTAGVVPLTPKSTTVHLSDCKAWDDEAKRRVAEQLKLKGQDSALAHYTHDPPRFGVEKMRVGGQVIEIPWCEVVLRPSTPQSAASDPSCTATKTTAKTPPPVLPPDWSLPPLGLEDPGVEPTWSVTLPPKTYQLGEWGQIRDPRVPTHISSSSVGRSPTVTLRSTVAAAASQLAQRYPTDPYFLSSGGWGQRFPDQWGLQRIGFTGGTAGRGSLWPPRGERITVAVIDTGVDRSHPDLAGALWTNARELPANGRDDDNNGFVDDVHGWNFADDNNDTADLNGHGTAVAGIIAAWTNNGIGIAGVNPWARVMPLRITTWSGQSSSTAVARAIRYAADHGARVINISYGGQRRTWVEYHAIEYARQKGVIIVAATGNEAESTQHDSPSGLAGVISVAATGLENQRLGFSNWGPAIDIAAPGWEILSLRARGTDPLRFLRDDYRPGSAIVGDDKRYYRLTGTSFAAPFVTGVASLILTNRPGLSDLQVMRMLLHSARDIESPGWDQYTGYGLLDAGAALRADPDFFVLSRIDGVAGRQVGKEVAIEIRGRARADKFRRAWIEGGLGKEPTGWIALASDLRAPVERGVIAAIPASRFAAAKEWTLRLIVEHQSGVRRESRFTLTLQ